MIHIQNNILTKYSRVLSHLKLRTLLYESYEESIYEHNIMINGIKTNRYNILLESVNNQIDVLYILYMNIITMTNAIQDGTNLFQIVQFFC
jgi:ribonuclease HIII